jgi:hypothetical protein
MAWEAWDNAEVCAWVSDGRDATENGGGRAVAYIPYALSHLKGGVGLCLPYMQKEKEIDIT